MSMNTQNFGRQLEQRNDQSNADVANAIKAANTGDDSNDESADVKDANANDGNGFVHGPATVKPTAMNQQGQSASVQHGPGASRVKP